MVLMMARPWKHPETGIYWFRKRVPDALRPVVGKREEKFSLKTREPEEAKRLHAVALVDVEKRWANLLAPARSLTERDAMELARPAYEWLYAAFEHNPSEVKGWDPAAYDTLFDATPAAPLGSFQDWIMVDVGPAMRKSEMLALVDQQVAKVMTTSGVKTDAIGQTRLQRAVAAALQSAALDLLKLRQFSSPASGIRAGLPSLLEGRPLQGAVPPVTFDSLIDGWALEKRPVEKTRYTWERIFKQLEAHVGHRDAARLTIEDLVSWKEALLKQGLSPRTVRNSKLAPVNAVLRWAADNRKLPSNVAEKVVVTARLKPDEGRRGFTDDEAKVVLDAARKEKSAHLRWLPWLSAYTGARISELAQMRKEDVTQVGELWVIRITAVAGSIKNVHSARAVPIHRRLVQEGFLKFIEKRGEGPLFQSLKPDRFGSRGGTATKLVGRWVRGLGIVDPRISPSHSWRHRFKTLARRHGLAGDLVNAIVGHERETVGDEYGEYELSSLARELEKIP